MGTGASYVYESPLVTTYEELTIFPHSHEATHVWVYSQDLDLRGFKETRNSYLSTSVVPDLGQELHFFLSPLNPLRNLQGGFYPCLTLEETEVLAAAQA